MRLVLIGFGVVGQSFVRLISKRRRELIARHGVNPKVVAILDTKGGATDPKGLNLQAALDMKRTTGTVANYPEVGDRDLRPLDAIKSIDSEVIVETTRTNVQNGEPGLGHIETAFKEGRHVITTNKGPLAVAFPALRELALHNGVNFLFSGTVGGGTPILDFGKRCLSTDRILAIKGILNGTTNFILGAMESSKMDFEDALTEARKLGYAEDDPSLDVDGWDTACKIVIMGNWLMGKELTLSDVETEGIRNITQEDMVKASERGSSIKLIGSVDDLATVRPTLVDHRDPLCVHGMLNAVKFTSESAGDEVVIGRGAGGMETASAMLRDLLELKERLASRWAR